MKKIINGSLYNTETAKKLGVWENNYNFNDFNYCSEELYITKSGKYFLYGEGGGMSRYASHYGNSSSWGEHIEPLSVTEAREWAEEHLEADEYIDLFGNVDEASDDKVNLNISISLATKTKLEQMRSEQGKSISQIITDIINNL